MTILSSGALTTDGLRAGVDPGGTKGIGTPLDLGPRFVIST